MSIVKCSGFTLIEILIALALSSIICISVFDCVASIEILYQRQLAIAGMQEKTRFLTVFFGEKIKQSGDFSCEPWRIKREDPVVVSYAAQEASDKWGVKIKAKTDLLQLKECIRFNGKLQYLPIDFFVADTRRVSGKGREIDALFMKIEGHHREELVPNLVEFRVAVENLNNPIVKIVYVLSSIDDAVKVKNPYWFDGGFVMPDNFALYQPGEIDVVPRYALS